MLNSLKAWLGQLSGAARSGLIGGTLLIVVLFCGLVYWAFASDYQVLFTELDPQDGHAIITELERMKVPYRLDDAGKTILVEKDQVYKTRLKLMGKGVNLRGTVGFEIFNESDFGMTDFAQRINYQRALQGEITRTIMGLEEVQAVRVHLVIPEAGLLKKNAAQAKASITINTKPGHTLSAEQVLGIQRLVAAAVPEIEASAVTILDNRGVALSKAHQSENDTPDVANRLLLKQQFEDYFVKKIVRILDQSFGVGQAIVSVDATINHDLLKITREDIVPATVKGGDVNGAVLRKKMSSQLRSLPKESSTILQSDRSNGRAELADQNTQDIEYQHGKKIEQLIANPGALQRLSVGVIVPSAASAEQIKMLSRVLALAVGLNPERGDAIAVYPLGAELKTAEPLQPVPPTDRATVAATRPHLNTTPPAHTQAVGQDWKLALLFGGLLLLLGLFALTRVWQGRASAAPRLNPVEREKLLQELQTWLQNPAPATTAAVRVEPQSLARAPS